MLCTSVYWWINIALWRSLVAQRPGCLLGASRRATSARWTRGISWHRPQRRQRGAFSRHWLKLTSTSIMPRSVWLARVAFT